MGFDDWSEKGVPGTTAGSGPGAASDGCARLSVKATPEKSQIRCGGCDECSDVTKTWNENFMTVASRLLLVEGLEEHLRVVKQLELAFELLSVVATRMCHALQSGHMAFWCGNGG